MRASIASKYSEIVKSTIQDFVKNDWQNKSFCYISESDIRSCLYVKLLERFTKNKIRLKVGEMGIQDAFDNENTLLIHCEMAVPENHQKHLDIGIWSENVPRNNIDYKDYPICIGIEIKYYWLKKPYATIINEIVKDVKKLFDVKNNCPEEFKGYVLVFLPRIDGLDLEAEIKNKLSMKIGEERIELNNSIEIYAIFAQSNSLSPLP